MCVCVCVCVWCYIRSSDVCMTSAGVCDTSGGVSDANAVYVYMILMMRNFHNLLQMFDFCVTDPVFSYQLLRCVEHVYLMNLRCTTHPL